MNNLVAMKREVEGRFANGLGREGPLWRNLHRPVKAQNSKKFHPLADIEPVAPISYIFIHPLLDCSFRTNVLNGIEIAVLEVHARDVYEREQHRNLTLGKNTTSDRRYQKQSALANFMPKDVSVVNVELPLCRYHGA